MLPACTPSDANGDTVIFALNDVTGLTEWVDYIPVQEVALDATKINRADDDGFRQCNALASSSGKVAWVDYTPVYIVTGRTKPWSTDAVGYIPVYLVQGSFSETDADFASVVLLLAFDGADAATATTDASNSAHVMTFANQAQLDTEFKKFGTAALLLDGTRDYVSTPDSADWDLDDGTDTDKWTVEMHYRPGTVGASVVDTLISTYITSNVGWELQYREDGGQAPGSIVMGRGDSVIGTANVGELTAGTWYHVAVSCDSGIVKIFLDGNLESTGTAHGLVCNTSGSLYIGALNAALSSGDAHGSIDNLRVTNGVARYSESFTAPTAAFPTS